MMEPIIRCLGCNSPLAVEAEVCPACRRPRARYEIDSARWALEDQDRENRRRPFRRALAVAAVGLVLLAYFEREEIRRSVSAERGEIASELQRISDPSTAPRQAPTAPSDIDKAVKSIVQDDPAARAVSVSTASSPLPAVSSAVAPSPQVPRPAGGGTLAPTQETTGSVVFMLNDRPSKVQRAARAAAAPKHPKHKFTVYGVVYELATAAPVAGARVYLMAGGKDAGRSAWTDVNGRYEFGYDPALRRRGELTLAVHRNWSEGAVVAESDPPYRRRSAAMRRADLSTLRDRGLRPVVMGEEDDAPVVHVDLVFVPDSP